MRQFDLKYKVPQVWQIKESDDRDFWRLRACGMTCLKMIGQAFLLKEIDPVDRLVQRGLKKNYYLLFDRKGRRVDRGWKHRGLLKMGKELGLEGYRGTGVEISTLVAALLRGYLICSSVSFNFNPKVKGGHLVVVKGFKRDGEGIGGFWVNDPSFKEGERFISVKRFTKSFAGNAIFFKAGPRILRNIKVSLDSRTIKPGDYFIPIKGEHFDGHDFIPAALKKGARGVLEEKDLYRLVMERIGEIKPTVIAVTGSYGKTTTKEMVYRVLSAEFRVHRTKGNLNTPVGVAQEIANGLKPKHQIFVAEVGMDRLGEIKKTCSIIKPTLGVITSVGEMHLEKLKTLENIKKAKVELLKALPKDGVAVLNYDDPNVREIAKIFPRKKIWYGFDHRADVGPKDIKGLKLRLLGKANLSNALAAYAVGRYFEIPEKKIFKALESTRSEKGRLDLLRGKNGAIVIDDTYNAGPGSMREALDVLGDFPARRRVAILGDMLELGKLEEKSHRRVLKQAFEVADILILYGPGMNRAFHSISYEEGAIKKKVRSYDQFKPARGDAILVKGSRGMKMEEVVNHLLLWKK